MKKLIDSLREEEMRRFEKWAKRHRVDVWRDKTGKDYAHDEAKLLWKCWQASAKNALDLADWMG